MSQQDFVTIEDAARALNKSAQTVRRMIKKGELPAQRVKTPQGFNYIIRKEDVYPDGENVSRKIEEADGRGTLIEKREEVFSDVQPSEEMFSNPPIQNPIPPQQKKEEMVLISQNQNLTSQNDLKPLIETAFRAIDRNMPSPLIKIIEMQHQEKMMLIHILESLQAELNQKNEKPQPLLDRIVNWFFE